MFVDSKVEQKSNWLCSQTWRFKLFLVLIIIIVLLLFFTLNVVLKSADPPQQQLTVGPAVIGGDMKFHQALRQMYHLASRHTEKRKPSRIKFLNVCVLRSTYLP
ncbi:hypothetical protein GOODEAATRI_034305 [Goodea atripinnis]|uniref:Uncharacterized protein n=1 Tax=Goodea atripinnis TaxID=208336 RepID=A0ABV0NSZ4_9TELE